MSSYDAEPAKGPDTMEELYMWDGECFNELGEIVDALCDDEELEWPIDIDVHKKILLISLMPIEPPELEPSALPPSAVALQMLLEDKIPDWACEYVPRMGTRALGLLQETIREWLGSRSITGEYLRTVYIDRDGSEVPQ